MNPPLSVCRVALLSRLLPGGGWKRWAPARRPRRSAGSVLIIVMITLVFTAFALITFMDKATNDLLVDHRDAVNRRLRREAYSSLEVTLAVLADFREANNGLHSPAEGWSDPLAFAGYTPAEGRTVDIAFDDESGKISLPHADAQTLSKLFQSWQVTPPDADILADALMGWMQREHVYATAISPDYEQSALPYLPPARPLRSYAELAAIDKVREFFYDRDGRPNENWRRFVASVSLLDFSKSNLNGARPETLVAVGQYDDQQQQQIGDYLTGRGEYETKGPGFFRDASEAQAIVGVGGNAGAFATTISALRILITVHEGRSQFRLAAVVTSGGGARLVPEAPPPVQATNAPTQSAAQRQVAPNAGPGAKATAANGQPAATQDLKYPFTLLEIQENDEIPAAPSGPAENPPP